jgi:hypothetical protein
LKNPRCGIRANRQDFEAAREKALKCGAAGFHVDDLKREFVEELIFRECSKTSRPRPADDQPPFNVTPSTRTSTSSVPRSPDPSLPEV